MATMGGKFSVKSFYDGMVQRGFKTFLINDYSEFLGSNKSEFFHLGSNV